MRKTLITIFAVIFSASCYSQTLELSISSHQPRLGEYFSVSFNSDTLSKGVFKLPQDKFKIDSYINSMNIETTLSVNLQALKAGENEIGPFNFTFNGKSYKTNKLKFTVADSLPPVNKGLWIRKVAINDTSFYILIDQRIPAMNYVTRKSNTISMTAKTSEDEKETEMNTEDEEDAKIESWGSSSSTKLAIGKDDMSYKSLYKCYKVTISDKKKPFTLTSKHFVNLPDYYKFTDIVILK